MTDTLEPLVFAGGRDVRTQLAIKRAIDIVLSGLGLVFLSPALLLIMLLVKTTSRGDVFYTCHWVGQGGRRFDGYKFRTMVADADVQEAALQHLNEMEGPAFKLTNDPRITPLGHVLRKYSLDELPQLWSVLKGDLSLVGPRPPRVHEYEQFTAFQRQKLTVQPGITCLWQVEGRHRINNYDDWVERDLEYIRTWSLGLDLMILAKTAGVVIKGTGI
ncbi:sugar transferase [Caulobacter sp. NIBR2454]|uniref:sugar transferase n=1 Tax=Caulobacter sp. NIBR2454 TaxID=3015996 RepID=UPI0022B685FF|nr:sugar transferase [Caulobacter sp. NIBR2454]